MFVKIAHQPICYQVILMKVASMIRSVISLTVLIVIILKFYTMHNKLLHILINFKKKNKPVDNAKMDTITLVNTA